MECRNCGKKNFLHVDQSWHQCTNCGWMNCIDCAGSGAVGTAFSGSDPSCEACDGEGAFNPEGETQ